MRGNISSEQKHYLYALHIIDFRIFPLYVTYIEIIVSVAPGLSILKSMKEIIMK